MRAKDRVRASAHIFLFTFLFPPLASQRPWGGVDHSTMSAPANGAAAAKRTTAAARQKAAASTKEDPRHTWNQQLIEACLACDLTRVKELVERGADPVNAREVPPPSFYLGGLGRALQEQQQQQQKKSGEDGLLNAGAEGGESHGYDAAAAAGGEALTADGTAAGGAAAAGTTGAAPADRLSPLAMMLLSGLNTAAARRVIAFLVECGASVNDGILFAGVREAAVDGDAAIGAGDDASTTPRSATAEAKKGAKKKHSVVGSRSNSVGQSGGGGGGGNSPTTAPLAGGGDDAQSQQGERGCTLEGSVLHYVVSRGDHAQLLRLLLLAAKPPPAPVSALHAVSEDPSASTVSAESAEDKAGAAAGGITLPYSLLSAVEQETVVGALRHQQMPVGQLQPGRPLSGSKGSAAVDDSGALSATLRGKARNTQSPTPSGPGSPNQTMVSEQRAAAAAAAPFAASAASVESVLAALQQRQQQQQQQAGAGALRRLPVLMTAYPVLCDDTSSPASAGAAATAGEQGGEAAVRNALTAMWSLQEICSCTTAASTATTAQPLASRVLLDLSLSDAQGRTAATTALLRGDTLSFRLLLFFGAPLPFSGLVNAAQTRLARACARGDVTRVEALLRQGDPIAQISGDGRYTLIHYAAAHPAVLKVLVDHGLSLEYENVWGETAVLSLQRHGTARNEGKYVQTLYATAVSAATAAAAGGAGDASPVGSAAVNASGTAALPAAAAGQPSPAAPVSVAVSNAMAFAHMSPSTQRNYILCPPLQLPSLTEAKSGGGGGGGGISRSATLKERSTSAGSRRISPSHSTAASVFISGPAAGVGTNAGGADAAAAAGGAAPPLNTFLGGREAGTWWSFLPPTTTTADAIDTLLKAGAVLQGYVPDDELELPYVRFAEAQAAAASAAAAVTNDGGRHQSDDWGEVEENEDSYASRASLSGSANTAAPTAHPSSVRIKGSLAGHRPQPSPGRLPLRVTPLQQAIVDYHPELIRRLVIDYRVDPMQRDSQGATALHYAALCSHAPSVLELLLSPQVMVMHAKASGAAGASAGGVTAAATAAAAGGAGTEAAISIPAAVASKIDLNSVDMAGRTPLFYAALVGNEEAVRLLLRFGALAQVGRADRDGWTPLHVAVRQQHPTVVELLIRHTKQLLSTAAAAGSADVFPELLAGSRGGSAGARRTSSRGGSTRRASNRSTSLNSANRSRRSGSNPSTSAAAAASGAGGAATTATDLLFANGAVALVDVEAEDRETHMTALEMLVKQTQPRVPASPAQMQMAVALLAEGQASSMRPSGLESGGTLLHRVVADGQVELTELLLSYYADPDEVDDADETPLFLAVRQTPAPPTPGVTGSEEASLQQQQRRRRTDLVRVLLQYGATPFAQSAVNLETPQHLAARSLAAASTDDVEELLQLLFYTAPDRKANAAAGGGASRRRRSEGRSRSREHGVLSRVLEAMEAESNQQQQQRRGSKRGGPLSNGNGVGGSQKDGVLRRRLNRNSSEGSRVDRRHSSVDGAAAGSSNNGSPGRDRRGVTPQHQPQQPSSKRGGTTAVPPLSTPPGSAAATSRSTAAAGGGGAAATASSRRKMWADESGEPYDGVSAHGELTAEEPLSFVNSSFASVGQHSNATNINMSGFGDDGDDRSAATSRPDSPETSTMTTTTLSLRGGEPESGLDGESAVRRAVLRQWQSAEHLLSPTHCWLLTNAMGQTPLHVLCSSACPAVQHYPPLLKLLADLHALTLQRDPSLLAAATRIGSGGAGDCDVLSLLWSLPDAQGRTPLHAAAESGFAEAVELILRLSPTSVVAVDAQGRTPLHACVLMAAGDSSSTSAPSLSPTPSSPALGEDGLHPPHRQHVVVEESRALSLPRMITALRGALTRLAADGAAVRLVGQPIWRSCRDVFPTPLRTTGPTAVEKTTLRVGSGGAAAAASRKEVQEAACPSSRLVAALVQPSTITQQLQRWQQTRHWGAPTLLRGADTAAAGGVGGGEAREPQEASAPLAKHNGISSSSGAEVRSWQAYMQLPDGQGRTALLLAAEVGNRSAARELLLQA